MTSKMPAPFLSVEALRAEFDRTFAAPPRAIEDVRESLLLMQAGGDPYAVRLTQVAALFVDKRIMWLPGSVSELLGVVAVRGTILPVYDLAALLGYPPVSAPPRWFVTVAAAPVALAFDRFDGHRRVAAETISSSRGGETRAPQVHDVVRLDDLMRPMIDMLSVVETIARLASPPARRSIE